jgi:hypothetical protein
MFDTHEFQWRSYLFGMEMEFCVKGVPHGVRRSGVPVAHSVVIPLGRWLEIGIT